MSKGYIIENYQVTKHDDYIPPVVAINEILEKYNGKFLVATPNAEVLVGKPLEVIIVIEFKNQASAIAFYNSKEYEVYRTLYEETTQGWIIFSKEYQKNNQ